MDTLKIRQGETLSIKIESEDESAVTARFISRKENETPVIDVVASFAAVDGKWVAMIETTDTNKPVGDYLYSVVLTFLDDTIDKLPDPDECEGDCDFPTLTICEALDLGVS